MFSPKSHETLKNLVTLAQNLTKETHYVIESRNRTIYFLGSQSNRTKT